MTTVTFISKDDINKLPLFTFKGSISLIETREDALVAVEALKKEKLLGFDTETRAAFRKGERYDVALLQLATETHAYLFRICKFNLIPELADILADKSITKVGVALRDDIKGLQRLLPFEDSGFIELADLAKKMNVQNFGLRALTAIFLGTRLSKREKKTNWQQDQLTRGQIMYAACDAVVGYLIYQKMSASSPKLGTS